MLLMIEELDDEMNHGSGKCRERNIPKDSLPCARYKIGHQSHGKLQMWETNVSRVSTKGNLTISI